MATLAIAAIAASMAVPSMQSLINNGQRTAGTNELVSTIHAARSIAITRNVQVTICTSSNAEQCDESQWHDGWIFFVDNDQNRQVDDDDEILGSADGTTSFTILSEDFERFLAFRPNGQVMVDSTAENSGEMLLCDERGPAFSHSLILHIGGKPSVTVDDDPETYAVCTSA